MNVKQILTAASLALLPLSASAASIIVPAAGSGPGANGSQWKSELTLHNVGSSDIAASLVFHDQQGGLPAVAVNVPAHATVSIDDIVKTKFGRDTATGAIEVIVDDAAAPRLTVTSRTYNVSANGEFGQDIPATAASDASHAGDIAVLAGPSSVANYRFNLGLYAISDTDVTWELVRADGTIAATRQLTYTAGTQTQYNAGVQALFDQAPANDDAIQATVTRGSAVFYGSAVNNATGDPTFVPGVKARPEMRIDFVGVDINEDGTVDVADANHDGVLDAPIDIFTTSGFPNYFRIVAAGQHGEQPVFELLDAGRNAMLIDNDGTVSMAPETANRGERGELHVRITAGGQTQVITIPINYR